MDYEVALEAKKVRGNDFFCTTTFPVGDDYCSLVVGGWGGTVVGLSSLNNLDASENDTNSLKDFKLDQWYKVKVRVTKGRIAAWIDDKQVVDADVRERKVSIRIECEPCKPFGIATYSTTGAVRDIKVRTLGGEKAAPEKKSSAGRKAGHLRMALVNIKSLYTDGADAPANRANLRANLDRHAYFIDRLSADGAEFVGFPELSVNGYHFSKTMTWLRLDGPEIAELRKRAVAKGVYIAVGIAEVDAEGRRWNTHVVIDPQGRIIGLHRKIWLTAEKGYAEAGGDHNVFDVKGLKVGIATCADGTDKKNLDALVKNGAQLIYGPHANTTGGTIAGWYKFRSAWGGPNGWIAQLKVHAALHNNAGLYNPEYDPPGGNTANSGWASGAWFIAPDGRTLAQMPASAQRADSKEYVLVYDVPVK